MKMTLQYLSFFDKNKNISFCEMKLNKNIKLLIKNHDVNFQIFPMFF